MCIWTFATKNKTARFISRQPITPTRGTVCFCWSSRQRPRGSSSVFTRTMSYNKYTKSRLSRHDAFLHHTCIRLPNPASGRFTNLKFTVMDSAGLIFDFDETEFGPNHGYVRSVIVERPICIVIDVPRLDTFFSFGR